MTKIFISYRRADSRKDAGRIYDRLVQDFGKESVFKDVDNIPLGMDFRGILREAVAQCDVLLAIIGRQWLEIKNEQGGRRLDDPADFVRIEIESALQRDSCLVIPVLVDNATMPKADDLPLDLRELAFNNATLVRDDPDFHADVTKLIRALEAQFGKVSAKPSFVFDVHTAISDFYKAFDEAEWEAARQILAQIRASGKAPKVFNADAHEQDIWRAIEAQDRENEYNVLRMMANRPNKTQVWEGLQIFWQTYPDYDPDNLARFQPQPPSVGAHSDAPNQQSSANPVRAHSYAPLQEATRGILGEPFEWITIPPGEFLYGHKSESDNPPQVLTLPSYAIAKYPITYSQFQVFVDDPKGFKNAEWWQGLAASADHKKAAGDQNWKIADHPRENVSWYDAVAFCRWLSWRLSALTLNPSPSGRGTSERADYDPMNPFTWLVRLPTEQEWEKAARGTDGREYPWGNGYQVGYANIDESQLQGGRHLEKTTPVTAYAQGASPYGALGMSGNVWEWCLTEYSSKRDDDLSNSNIRVIRGGSWLYNQHNARAVFRGRNIPFNRNYDFGLRVVCGFRPSE